MSARRTLSKTVGTLAVHGVLLAGAVLFTLPFVWLITTSLKAPDEIFAQPFRWLPKALRTAPIDWRAVLMNYREAREFVPFGLWLKNTAYVAGLNVVLGVLSCSLVAYGFSRIQWRGRDLLFVLLLATMMLPGQVTMIPVFLIYNWLGWYNTLKPLWVGAAFGGAFNIFLVRQFLLTIPRDLEDAAKIDGCGHLRIYASVMMPLIKPALAVIAIHRFQGAWNDFLGPYIYVNTADLMTLSLGLQFFRSEHGSMYGQLMATSAVMTLPILLLFFFCQRYMIQGITLTGLKG